MLVYLISLIVIWFLAYAITRQLAMMLRKNKASYFLSSNKTISLSWFHDWLDYIGRNRKTELKQKFDDAGFYHTDKYRYFIVLKYALFTISLLIVFIYSDSTKDALLNSSFAIVAILVLPDMYLAFRKKRLIKKNSKMLPYLIDMTTVCLQTGMTLEATLSYLGEELSSFDKDLCYQIKMTSHDTELKGVEYGLKGLALRVPTPEVRSFSLTLIQNMQYGTSIADVLSDLSTDMRRENLLTMEEKVGKLSAKMSVPLILLIMFPIIVLILAPSIVRLTLGFANL